MPMRVVAGGIPFIPGDTVVKKAEYSREHTDNIRSLIVLESRDFASMFGAISTEPTIEEADLKNRESENPRRKGYSPGHVGDGEAGRDRDKRRHTEFE